MISFANATGNLFNRLGKCGLLISQMRTNQNAQFINMTNTSTGVVAQFNSESDIQALMGSDYISQLNSDSVGDVASSIAGQTVNRMVFRDNPQFQLSLLSLNTLTCLNEIIRQMKIEGATILQQTVSAVPIVVSNPGPSFTGIGNGVINVSVIRPSDGLTLQNVFQEQVQFLCISDSYLGNQTAGNELYQMTGTGDAGVFDFNWPLGSNLVNNLNAINGDSNNSNGNLLTNSGFSTFTVPNTPNNWFLSTGTPGTNIFQETTIVYGTGGALRILGDGATVIDIRQRFNNSSGTTGQLQPLTAYSFNMFMRRDGVAATGILTIDLIDGGNNVIQDANGINNSFTFDLSTLSTNYASFTGLFRTPLALPSQQWLRIRTTTPYSNGRSFYLDKLSVGPMTQMGAWGIFAAVHSGSVNAVQGDYGYVTVSNGRGSGGTLNTFQTLLFRCFPEIQANEIIFPYSTTPSISDSLIG